MQSDPAPTPAPPGSTPATDIAVVRRTLRRLMLVVTALVLVSIPALFSATGLRGLHARAALHAWVTAERVADHRSEEHTSELQSLMRISYAVLCWKKTKKLQTN